MRAWLSPTNLVPRTTPERGIAAALASGGATQGCLRVEGWRSEMALRCRTGGSHKMPPKQVQTTAAVPRGPLSPCATPRSPILIHDDNDTDAVLTGAFSPSSSVIFPLPHISAEELARNLAENLRLYGEDQSPAVPPPSPGAASGGMAAPATPATLPKRQLPPQPKPAASAAAAESFLLNRDLHGLEPALTIRTRILLGCHSMNQMKMGLDIAKSFEIAGYFPRQRFACLV